MCVCISGHVCIVCVTYMCFCTSVHGCVGVCVLNVSHICVCISVRVCIVCVTYMCVCNMCLTYWRCLHYRCHTVAACYSVLQCVAVCCSVLQSATECCSVLHLNVRLVGVTQDAASVAVCCSVLQCVAVCCSVLQCVAVECSHSRCDTYWRSTCVWCVSHTCLCVLCVSDITSVSWTYTCWNWHVLNLTRRRRSNTLSYYRSLLQNIVSFKGLFCSRNLSFWGA